MTVEYPVPCCIPSIMRKEEAPLYDEWLKLQCILFRYRQSLPYSGKTWANFAMGQWAYERLMELRNP